MDVFICPISFYIMDVQMRLLMIIMKHYCIHNRRRVDETTHIVRFEIVFQI